MENSSQFTWFKLSIYSDMGSIRYFYFSVIIILYLSIIIANSLLIGLIVTERSLHKPMYFLLSSLFVNELYGSTGIFPWLLYNMLSDVHHISKFHCATQIFCLHTYGGIEFTNLAVMAYDRYVSICYPLRYIEIMSPFNVYMLIAFIWLYSFGKVFVILSLTLHLHLCGNVINKVYCGNYALVKLVCENAKVNYSYGYFMLFLSVGLPLVLIFYSYVKILKICVNSSKQSRQKALNTCTPHIVSLLNFTMGSLFEILQNQFNMTHVPVPLRIIMSVYFLMICPILNPVIYGLSTANIRISFKKFCMKYGIISLPPSDGAVSKWVACVKT